MLSILLKKKQKQAFIAQWITFIRRLLPEQTPQTAACGHIILKNVNGTANSLVNYSLRRIPAQGIRPVHYKILKKSPALADTESLFVFAWQDIFISVLKESILSFIITEVVPAKKLPEQFFLLKEIFCPNFNFSLLSFGANVKLTVSEGFASLYKLWQKLPEIFSAESIPSADIINFEKVFFV